MLEGPREELPGAGIIALSRDPVRAEESLVFYLTIRTFDGAAGGGVVWVPPLVW